jgi:hypothetical protein
VRSPAAARVAGPPRGRPPRAQARLTRKQVAEVVLRDGGDAAGFTAFAAARAPAAAGENLLPQREVEIPERAARASGLHGIASGLGERKAGAQRAARLGEPPQRLLRLGQAQQRLPLGVAATESPVEPGGFAEIRGGGLEVSAPQRIHAASLRRIRLRGLGSRPGIRGSRCARRCAEREP